MLEKNRYNIRRLICIILEPFRFPITSKCPFRSDFIISSWMLALKSSRLFILSYSCLGCLSCHGRNSTIIKPIQAIIIFLAHLNQS